jgi:Rrf2 family iron-sulfur cluster assembly transcriptional regulator
MKISAQEEYGLRCLLQLASLGEGEFLTLAQIAEREGISQANAGKLLWTLTKSGLVTSLRGAQGGYRLSRPATEVRLSEVIRVHDDEDIRESHCSSYTGLLESCIHTGDCGIRPVIVELREVVQRALAGITLAQLLGTEAKVDAALHQIQGIEPRSPSAGPGAG